MRRPLAPCSGPELLVHTRSLADCITTTSGRKFSVHTPGLDGTLGTPRYPYERLGGDQNSAVVVEGAFRVMRLTRSLLY